MKLRDSDLKAIEDELRSASAAGGQSRGRGTVSGTIEKLLPAIEARRANGTPHSEIIDLLIERNVVASAAAYWTALRIARRNYRESVLRKTPALGSAGAVAPAHAPAGPAKGLMPAASPSPAVRGSGRLRMVPVEPPAGATGQFMRLEEIPGEPLGSHSSLRADIGKVVELVTAPSNLGDGPIPLELIERRLADLVGDASQVSVVPQAGTGSAAAPWDAPGLSLKQKSDLLADRYFQPKSSPAVRALADHIANGGEGKKEGET